MLRPREDALALSAEFARTGRVQVGTVTVQRQGNVGYLLLGNPRFLNAEDDSVVPALEIGTDLLLLDPSVEVCVLRGQVVEHPKYAGRRVFNAGINLTHLYQGQISYLFYLLRDLGPVNKMYRGLTGPDFLPDEPETTLEKPWIAAVEAFAIGGGCQILLVMDHCWPSRTPTSTCRPARRGSSRASPTCGCRASWEIAWPGKGSCSTGSSRPTAPRGG
jgi:thioesterase DpgC